MNIDKKIFFDNYKKRFDNNLSQQEVNDIDLFLTMVNSNLGSFTTAQWAYIFATTWHETAHTFHPVIEAYWKTEDWRKRNFRYYPYYGRGYVQITWEANYKKYSQKLGVDLVKNPEKVLEPKISFFILTDGFKNGVFTGKKISDYISGTKKDYVNARRCINGLDKASDIAEYAKGFEAILNLAIK